MTLEDFDGKRLRKSVMRKTVDYNSAIIKALQVNITLVFLLKFTMGGIYCYLTVKRTFLDKNMAERF